jgi:ribosomal RNA-processing protein 12
MISASITAITRILFEFRQSLSAETMSDLVQTMDLFLTSNNREIVRSVLGFVKVSVTSLPIEMMQPRLSTLIPNLMIWSHEHAGHSRAKVKHIIERMIRRFGFEPINKYCPEADRKLLTNIRKTKERSKRKKAAAKEAGANDDDKTGRRASRFESEYDQALYSSDDSDLSDDSDNEASAAPRRGGRKGGDTYIVEADDEPLDLLDRKVLASISSTKPTKMKRAGKSKARTDLDGKLILGEAANGEEPMEVDTVDTGAQESAVGAYVAALRGKDAPKRGLRGKIKWSNKGSKNDEDGEDDGDDDVAMEAVARSSHAASARGGRRFPGRDDGRRGNRAGKGGIAAGRRGSGGETARGRSSPGRVRKPFRGRR